jgi:GntR family transcriptional regulator
VPNLDQLGKLSRKDSSPLYLQLQKTLREAIVGNVFAADDAIPAERDLAEGLDVSRITVRKAIDGLIEEGLLTRRRGAGTFVTSRIEKSISKISSFSEDMMSRGRTPHSEWLSKISGTVTPEEALALSLSPGALVYRFNRIRFADKSTMALEFSTIPSFCLDSLEAVESSIYDALDASAFRPVRALQRLRAVSFSREHADLLGIDAGAPCLFIERRGFLTDGRAVEYTRSYYRGDAYDLVAELNS